LLKCYIEPSACVQVVGDESRLRQVLVNLLGNALKFTVSGDVTVRVDITQRRERQLTIRFSVTDTGLGIPEERRDRLFCPFSQVDSSTSRKFGGTGLGLSICKQLVEMMGGKIDVESQVGVGSTFWFELPLEIVANSGPEEGDRQGLRGTRVLVVAASERRHAQVDDCLKAWGCSTEPADSLREALDAMVHAETAGAGFAAVLLDVRTATGQNAALLQELVGRGLPTIGWGLSEDEQEVARVRGRELRQWLRDPVCPSDLYNALATSLSITCAAPLEDAPGSSAEPPRLEISGHVLVAEDNRINQMYIVELLKQCGCTCDLAANGHEALEAVQHRRYDLVLMDCQMPEMDGLTAAREIRRREALQETSSHLPIVALTANALQGDRARCLEAGMDDYLTKPLETRALYATLKKTIGTRSDQRAVSEDPTQDGSLAVAPFDVEGLLTRCFGNLDFAWSLLEEFETSGCERVEAIRRSAAQQDAHAAAEAAHALKGAAGILCATSLSKVAAQVEAMGRSGDLEGIGPLVDELAHELQQCLTYLPTLREETRTAHNASA
jgi:Amt family ammonium transporter